MNEAQIESIVQAVLAELQKVGAGAAATTPVSSTAPSGNGDTSAGFNTDLVIDLDDPTTDEHRFAIGVKNPYDPEGLRNLRATTTARIAVGRAGPRPTTRSLLLFQADHGVTQDAIMRDVDPDFLERMGLFSVQTQVKDREEFLLRPDLGRKLSDEAKRIIAERCVKGANVQICVGDGLSAAAIENNLEEILPVIQQGLEAAGITTGTLFFIRFCRVGVMNDVNDVVGADMVLLLIGERPGLGIADALSAYMGYKPTAGKTDADRDVICMITRRGGTNPLEGGAYVVELIKKTLQYKASGVKLRQLMAETRE
jgi:ethanolamine ammonia-lyase small subunit